MRTVRLCLLAAAVATVCGCPGKKESPSPASKPVAATKPAASAQAAANLEKAFTAGDAQAAAALMDPRLEKGYRRTFQANPDVLPRLGKLLATRKLRLERGRLAEYQVTEDGQSYTLLFEQIDGQWRLMGL